MRLSIILLVAVSVFIGYGAGRYMIDRDTEMLRRKLAHQLETAKAEKANDILEGEEAYKLGALARREGAEATANPYRVTSDRVYWLRGWLGLSIDGKEKFQGRLENH